MKMSEGLIKLEERRQRAVVMGGEVRIKRQLDQGKLTVRHRVGLLLELAPAAAVGEPAVPERPRQQLGAGRMLYERA